MRLYKTINISGAGDYIASVTGSTGDYDITTDSGHTLTGYDETGGSFSTAAPAAGDLLLFGAINGLRQVLAANAEVIPAAVAADFFRPVDGTL